MHYHEVQEYRIGETWQKMSLFIEFPVSQFSNSSIPPMMYATSCSVLKGTTRSFLFSTSITDRRTEEKCVSFLLQARIFCRNFELAFRRVSYIKVSFVIFLIAIQRIVIIIFAYKN